MASNPFLDPDFHIRWSRLAPDQIAPAIETAISRAQAGIDAIAARDFDSLTYPNTFLALEQATEELTVTWGKISHLQSVADAPALREAHNAVLPRVVAFQASVPLNAPLWSRLKAFASSSGAAKVCGVHRRFMEETLKDFRQAGADLPKDSRARLQLLQSELAELTQRYSENVLDSTNGWQLIVEEESRLAGLPDNAKAAARQSAQSKGVDGWRFTLHTPSLEPFMTYVEDDALRCEMWKGSAGIGATAPHDNTSLIQRILALRAEKAALLGYPNFADLVLERRMAKSGARALAFIEDLQRRAGRAFEREARELERFKAQQTGSPEGRLAPWEISFWSERLRRTAYDFDEELLRPYFPIDGVVAGLFELVRRVFGLNVVQRAAGEVETWHEEVTYYDVFAGGGRHIGSFFADWYPRESKRGGAWMNYLITGGPLSDGARAPHLGLICGNVTPPVSGRAALLTHREVATIFHEFGHLLHHLLGEVEIKSMNGVNVAWDFVELPSQMLENWVWERESLDLFARHHETGGPIPAALFDQMIAARNFRSASATMRQVAFARMDLLLHLRTADFISDPDIERSARVAIEDCLIPTEPRAPTIVKRFTHIFADAVGYAAGYYSYKWAEVLDADAFTRFNTEGIFSQAVGSQFVEHVLSRGNSADPAELYRAFMGREPDLNALLRRSGLLAAT